jgi:hypothetical protein
MNTEILVPAARTFVAELDDAYPGRGTTSDGSVASSEHSAANPRSDHEPGPAGSPSPGKVDAVDIDRDLIPGDVDASVAAMLTDVIPTFQRHPGTQYWIYRDQICHRSEGWAPRSYAYAGPGRNRHTQHAHFNWLETSAAHNNTEPYVFRGVDDMEPVDLMAFDPGLDAAGKVRRGGIPNPRPAEAPGNPTIAPNTALYRGAAAYDVALRIESTLKKGLAVPVALTDADRAAITQGVAESLRAELPALVRAALADIEYAPRKATP